MNKFDIEKDLKRFEQHYIEEYGGDFPWSIFITYILASMPKRKVERMFEEIESDLYY